MNFLQSTNQIVVNENNHACSDERYDIMSDHAVATFNAKPKKRRQIPSCTQIPRSSTLSRGYILSYL